MRVHRLGHVLVVLAGLGCEEKTPEASPDSPPKAAPAVELVAVPASVRDGPTYFTEQRSKAEADGKKLLVYVGATWCEPCVAFHEAAAAGQLDDALRGLRLLELDADVHGDVIASANCSSKLVPLFAALEDDGTCSAERRSEGAIKGEGAVAFLRPRIEALLK